MLFTGRVKWPKWKLHIYIESYSSLCRAWMILYGFEYRNYMTSIFTWEFKRRKGLGLLRNSNLLKLVLWTGATCTSPSWKEMLLRIIMSWEEQVSHSGLSVVCRTRGWRHCMAQNLWSSKHWTPIQPCKPGSWVVTQGCVCMRTWDLLNREI